jgi:ABC-type lipoprotein export system ATPase subunit
MASVVGRTRGVVKTYGRGPAMVRVLAGADIDLFAGELVAIVGRSGSGKSSLLHVLGGLDRADSGLVEIDGMRLDTASERALTSVRRRKVGFVFQAFHLLPELTGLENVLLPARLARDRKALRRGVELVELLGLADIAHRLPIVLSGGEQQRLAIARALVNDPPLVLADEPTGNLDGESADTVLDLLRDVAVRGKAVAIVTHEEAAVDRADRVLHLREGRLS